MEVIRNKDHGLLRVASGSDRVYKDECIYCFNTPECEGGLYVSLSSFLGLCRNHLQLHYSKTCEPLYLQILLVAGQAMPLSDEATPLEEVISKPTRLAIGMDGGFDGGQQRRQEMEQSLAVVAMPELSSVAWPCDQLSQQVQSSVSSVMSAITACKQDTIASWDGEKRLISKFAEGLVQLDNGVNVPPSGWKCTYCDLTSNLWMNLTDGTILCGRKYFEGSGGNNHAVQHYDNTRYPLAVKLGTITPEGADVYSYAEDDMVQDPRLTEHLAHFGIDVASMTKTDATMTELEIDINMRIGEWGIIQESGKQLHPCYGPGYTGMVNLGNSCYLNSIMQIFFTLPEFQQRYYVDMAKTFQAAPANATTDFETQMSKLAAGLLSGDYSQPPTTDPSTDSNVGNEPNTPTTDPSTLTSGAVGTEKQPPAEPEGISPTMFKALIGKGHPEFSSARQQDAQEFFLHMLCTIDKQQRLSSCAGRTNPVNCFRFQLEDRVQCVVSGKVSYSHRDDFLLQLPVPIELATNKADVEQWEARKKGLEANKQRINPDDVVRAQVPFSVCLKLFSKAQEVEDFYSTALAAKSTARKTVRMATFPEYLMVQMAKFSFAEDWVPKKYDVLIDVPDTLDLSCLKAHGLQPGEVELPNEPAAEGVDEGVEVDEGMVVQLVSMGFDVEGCKKAVYHTHNQGVELAMTWILEHMGDADFAAPFVMPSHKSAKSSETTPPDDAIAMVVSMGFTNDQALRALKATGNNVERAVDWVFSHASELDSAPMETEPVTSTEDLYKDGPTSYELLGFVSHMGTSTMCGHYVCHIKKEGRWVIFNDRKVAMSEQPPKQLGYLYLYKRTTA